MAQPRDPVRAVAVVIGAIVMCVAAFSLSFVFAERGSVPWHDSPIWTLVLTEDDLPRVPGGQRSVATSISTSGSQDVDIELVAQLELSTGNQLVADVRAGDFRANPDQFVWNVIGFISFYADDFYVPLDWSPPVIEYAGDATTRISVAARGSTTMPRTLLIRAGPAFSCDCRLALSLESNALGITGVRPPDQVSEQSERSLQATVTDFVEINLDNPHAADSAPSTWLSLPPGVEYWPGTLALFLWPLMPWLYVRRHLRVDMGQQGSKVVQWRLSRYGDSLFLLISLGVLALILALYYREVPAFAIFAIWAWIARRWVLIGSRIASILLPVCALALGAISLLVGILFPEYFSNPLSDLMPLAAGIVLGVFGSLLLAYGIAGGGWLGAALIGIGVLLTGSLLSTTAPGLGSGILAAICGVALVAMLLWVTAVGTGHRRPRTWRGRSWVRGLVLLLALTLVIPRHPWPDSPSPLIGSDIISLAYSMWFYVPAALLVVGIALVWTVSRYGISRSLAVAIAIALLFRPDVQFMWIPWSLLVGAVLVVTVLLPVRADTTRPLRPNSVQNTEVQIQGVLDSTSRAHSVREMQRSLRTKVAAGELPDGDADQIRRVVHDAFERAPVLPTRDERLDAFAWAGQANSWRRAWIGGIAAGIVGLVLQSGNLMTSLSDVSAIVGQEPWTVIVPTVMAFRFPLYGLVFGFLYPLIPGTTGLTKATRLFIVLAVSELVVILVPPEWSADTVAAVALRFLQLGVLCVVLGIGGDVMALRRVGSGLGGLRDLYHTSRLVLWSSGVVAAVATTLATAALSSAATLLIERAIPEPPPEREQAQNESGTPRR